MGDHRAGPQTVENLAGARIEHVPANLCHAFAGLVELGLVEGTIHARATGQPQLSQQPPAWARSRRGRGRGGGMRDQPSLGWSRDSMPIQQFGCEN